MSSMMTETRKIQIYYSAFCKKRCYKDIKGKALRGYPLRGNRIRVVRNFQQMFSTRGHASFKCWLECNHMHWNGEKYVCLMNQMMSVEKMQELWARDDSVSQ